MSEWREVALAEIAHIQQGRRVNHLPVGESVAPMYGANGVIGSWHKGMYDFDVIGLGCRGSVGTIHTIPAGSWLGNNVMGVWPRDGDEVLLPILGLLLEHSDLRGTGVITGQVQPQITQTSLSPLVVSVPPIDEQHRIVNIIASIDLHRQALQNEVESLKIMRVAVMDELLSQVIPASVPSVVVANDQDHR